MSGRRETFPASGVARDVISVAVALLGFIALQSVFRFLGSPDPTQGVLVGAVVYLLARDFRRETWGEDQ